MQQMNDPHLTVEQATTLRPTLHDAPRDTDREAFAKTEEERALDKEAGQGDQPVQHGSIGPTQDSVAAQAMIMGETDDRDS